MCKKKAPKRRESAKAIVSVISLSVLLLWNGTDAECVKMVTSKKLSENLSSIYFKVSSLAMCSYDLNPPLTWNRCDADELLPGVHG